MPRGLKSTRAVRGNAPLIYEVRLSVEPEIQREFDRWLGGHARDMIALPGFYDARIIRADPGADTRARRIVRYRLRDRAALREYLEHHAPRMRAEGLDRFGERFQAERDVYAALPERGEAGERRCANCGAFAETYCPVCGQEQKNMHVSFWRLVQDFLDDIFTFDSRLVRSLRPLLARPGFLTREYIEGRRARYIPPLRLYLFVSIVFFGLLGLMFSGIEINRDGAVITLDQPEAAQVDSTDGHPRTWIPELDKSQTNTLERRFLERGKKVEERPEIFARDLLGNLPVMMFLLLPVYALVLRLLYPLAGFVYVEHLIFALHVHAFTFLVFTFILVANWVADRYAPDAVLWPWQTAALTYLAIYPWLAIKRTYRQGFILTTFKYLGLGLAYLVLLLLAIVGVSVATLYWF